MTSVKETCARFDTMPETFEIFEGQPSKSYITKIVEELGGILVTICYDSEKAKLRTA